MNEEEKLQAQIQDIGNRYLQRTLGELPRLRELLQQARAGDAEALAQSGRIVHKVHGSGAMFGFDAISDQARELEVLIGEQRAAQDFWPRVDSSLAQLDVLVHTAASARGVR
jgi:HPt (histidine-containing phosphotransfer) domain-containing protein